MGELKELDLQRAINLLCQMYLPSFDEEEHNALYTALVALEEKKNKYYNYEKINEKLAVILDRLDRIEKKIDDKNTPVTTLPPYPPTFPGPYYNDNPIRYDKITCNNETTETKL